ncbi:uncharacterized protein LOC126990847 [Eriocheir sinensis]|uniref:uncharacterized protein LOC126990847 n=1 Tax=Eriocheir sinensis TaxID=95602 RepID=UPI0021C7B5F0|nr:uncharacterized protein LOC126990847 [Eriocheir sinensis]
MGTHLASRASDSECRVQQEALTLPYPLFVALNIGPALVAAFLGSYVEYTGFESMLCDAVALMCPAISKTRGCRQWHPAGQVLPEWRQGVPCGEDQDPDEQGRGGDLLCAGRPGRGKGQVVGKVCGRELTTKMLLPTVPAMAKGRVARTTDDGPLLDKEDLDTLFCGTSSSSLHIHGLQEEDEGTYRCWAENRDLDTLFCGTSSSSLHIHGLQEEDEGTYRCWAENRDLDTLFCGTSSSSLHIHGLQEEDEGTYRCWAENREDSPWPTYRSKLLRGF